ncbi:MAG: branched-chain amino acid transaminase [archaeon]|nr:branched-chain amino acid transaminase [archaeon]
MEEVEWIWLNGKFVKWADAKVHVLSHALHYGGGVFEGIRCYDTEKGPAVFRLNDHMKRLYYSAEVFGLKIPFKRQELYDLTLELIAKNGLTECYIRPIAYYGYGQMGLNPIGAKVDVSIAAWPWGAYLGEEGIKNGIRMKISPWIRPPTNVMPTNAKVNGNYVNSILAKVDAVETGFEEAILLDIKGNVAECTGENLFIVKDNVLITPPTDNTLKGITRDSIMQIALDFEVKVEERLFNKDKLYAADEAFLTGTAAEVTPIREVDGKKIGEGKPGPITKKLQAKYYESIHGKAPEYEKWLDFVK